MASYGNGAAAPGMTEHSAPSPHWYEQQKSQDPNARSVTPAMNNTRGVVRNGAAVTAAPYVARGPSPVPPHSNAGRSPTPQQRYYGAYNSPNEQDDATPQPPPSTGLIRLTLRKPMGIVFEPMYDPNNPSTQRGVRICDLPRTGAAALSQRLEVGDELLSINDKTMSRLTFDEIMDFIIEADPDQVNLLFRRPRKTALPARVPKPVATPANASVKWPDDDQRKSKKDKKKSPKDEKEKDKKSSSKKPVKRDEESTIQSAEDSETVEPPPRRKGRSHRDMYENESFLDMLIDTICGKPDGYCGDRPKPGDDDYYSDEDGTFASFDDSTYVTYDSEPPVKAKSKRGKGKHRDDDSTAAEETEDDTTYASPEEEENHKSRKGREKKASGRTSPTKEPRREERAAKVTSAKHVKDRYEDDGTFETIEEDKPDSIASPAPLEFAPAHPEPKKIPEAPPASETEDETPAPIAELEYDDFDHGADVSVMESLGGPSLLIEKQRQASAAAKAASTSNNGAVPAEIVNNFGDDFPSDFGLTREQTIQKHPMKFYSHVVKGLLEEHEPEKVRLLDKLLAKYKGREDHLVQKLSVRYTKDEGGTPTIPEEDEGKNSGFNFSNAVNQTKGSAGAAAAVKTAKERMQVDANAFGNSGWPVREAEIGHEVLEEGEEVSMGSESVSGSEYSGDSIDGTSPAVIAQVSELLNYVYGKTSVPGQIDRVSTIMRAYEGREAVLLELLETKALIKANGEKENAADLPSFLRNSPALQLADGDSPVPADENKPVSPLSNPNMMNQGNPGVGGTMINDDVSSMSGVSSPADNADGEKAVVSQGT